MSSRSEFVLDWNQETPP